MCTTPKTPCAQQSKTGRSENVKRWYVSTDMPAPFQASSRRRRWRSCLTFWGGWGTPGSLSGKLAPTGLSEHCVRSENQRPNKRGNVGRVGHAVPDGQHGKRVGGSGGHAMLEVLSSCQKISGICKLPLWFSVLLTHDSTDATPAVATWRFMTGTGFTARPQNVNTLVRPRVCSSRLLLTANLFYPAADRTCRDFVHASLKKAAKKSTKTRGKSRAGAHGKRRIKRAQALKSIRAKTTRRRQRPKSEHTVTQGAITSSLSFPLLWLLRGTRHHWPCCIESVSRAIFAPRYKQRVGCAPSLPHSPGSALGRSR